MDFWGIFGSFSTCNSSLCSELDYVYLFNHLEFKENHLFYTYRSVYRSYKCLYIHKKLYQAFCGLRGSREKWHSLSQHTCGKWESMRWAYYTCRQSLLLISLRSLLHKATLTPTGRQAWIPDWSINDRVSLRATEAPGLKRRKYGI